MAVVGQLMGIWMQGNSPLATEIDNLLAALKNSNDPLLKENLNLFERKILWSMLNTLTKNKEMFMRQQQLSEQNK